LVFTKFSPQISNLSIIWDIWSYYFISSYFYFFIIIFLYKILGITRKDKTVNSLLEGSANFFNLMPVAPPQEKLIKHRSSNVYSCLSCTTGIRAFAECQPLCRVLFHGHSAKKSLPRAILGKVLRSVKRLFTECRTLGTEKHSANTLPNGKHSAKTVLGKGPLAAVYSWRPSAFVEGRKLTLGKADSLPSVKYLALGKEGLYRVSSVDTRQSIFYFFILATKLFVVCSYTV
jgi:predicted permease